MAHASRNFSEAKLSHAQDKVSEGYQRNFELAPSELIALHMFFSPARVPKGLTKYEVRIVLMLCPLRDAYRRKRIAKYPQDPRLSTVLKNIMLPAELRPTGRMTRKSFKTGVMKLLREMSAD